MSYQINLPSYSIGTDVYYEIDTICSDYGTTVVVIGGVKAISAAKDYIIDGVKNSNLRILDFLPFGGECSMENIEQLEEQESVKESDMIFAVGGGKAIDTAKMVGDRLKKPVFSFPTIASNCSACTSVSILYHADGTFMRPNFFDKPPVHAFIQTEIIAKSPVRYLWAGMGDTYAKYFEGSISSRNEEVPHYIALGVANASMCYQPIMKYGQKAYQDMKEGITSKELEQVILAIIVSTAVASILLCTDHIIDYNTGLAHAIFYGLTSFPVIEKFHLHGEVVAYGVLVLLLVDHNKNDLDTIYAFHKSVGLPTKLKDLDLEKKELDKVAEIAATMKDILHNPYPVTKDMIKQAMLQLETME